MAWHLSVESSCRRYCTSTLLAQRAVCQSMQQKLRQAAYTAAAHPPHTAQTAVQSHEPTALPCTLFRLLLQYNTIEGSL